MNTEQDSERKIQQTIDAAIAELGKTTSDNKLTHIGWLVYGLDLWHQTAGDFGHNKDDATRYVISNVARLIGEAEVRARIDEFKEIQCSVNLSDEIKDKLYEYYIEPRLAQLLKKSTEVEG